MGDEHLTEFGNLSHPIPYDHINPLLGDAGLSLSQSQLLHFITIHLGAADNLYLATRTK